ncbi:polysaccharide lyase 6 family protein [Glaciecola petra]|uniref:Polysaccharide lyase 6 family protein n=1 Tax=Glaciecola petra TaxID=3075602 RepID=A0ABU2ZRL2_9ALTE|nr:polysaccharide lyase 6 family protein [Aestuariibacter sp. P117]MDT0595274.1 polysaccharide lyase 6 family protein [Aestuariibacter sp. P117]
MKSIYHLLFALFFISACGGGSNANSPETPAPTPIPPTIEPPSQPPMQNDTSIYNKPTNYNVTAISIEHLKSEISSASAGDVIALANGTYVDVELDITKDGVIVVAETSGSVFIEGSSTIELSGDDIIFEGFTFINGQPKQNKGAIIINGHRNRVTNCKIDHFDNEGNDYKWISFNNDATYGEIDHCTFTGKQTEGALLVVWRNNENAQYHKIYRNIFSDHQYNPINDVNNDTNGWEAIRVGTSAQSQSSSYSTVEYNYFFDINGEIEIISNKSGHNTYQYNTFESSSGMLTLRHGNNCVVDSNYFLIDNTSGGGIRIIDKGHTITNNYIEGAKSNSNARGAIALSSSLKDGVLSGYWEVSDVTIANNTVINSAQSLHYGSNSKRYPPKSATIRNNLIRNNIDGDGEADFIKVAESRDENNAGELLNIVNPTYENNFFFGSPNLGLPEGTPAGIELIEVELSKNNNGQYFASEDSLNVGAPEIERLGFDSSVGSSF